jgi:hypothetical protein
MEKNGSSRYSFKLSFIVGLSFTSIGLVLSLTGWTSLGMAFFFFLPLAIGISSGLLPDLKQAIFGTLTSLAVFSAFLVFTQIEGLICVLMALPILMLAMWIGWAIGRSIRRKRGDLDIKVTVAPLLIFVVANALELFSGSSSVPNSATTSIILNSSTNEVYNAIIEVDTVDVETNFLQKAGLPTPRKCILTSGEVGGLRICEFEEGEIIETIVKLEPNKYLEMDITECNLDRERHWLDFDKDIYEIEELDSNSTRITRTTTYSSTLKPRVYWEIMEEMTINSEHDFVFRNLKKEVEK